MKKTKKKNVRQNQQHKQSHCAKLLQLGNLSDSDVVWNDGLGLLFLERKTGHGYLPQARQGIRRLFVNSYIYLRIATKRLYFRLKNKTNRVISGALGWQSVLLFLVLGFFVLVLKVAALSEAVRSIDQELVLLNHALEKASE